MSKLEEYRNELKLIRSEKDGLIKGIKEARSVDELNTIESQLQQLDRRDSWLEEQIGVDDGQSERTRVVNGYIDEHEKGLNMRSYVPGVGFRSVAKASIDGSMPKQVKNTLELRSGDSFWNRIKESIPKDERGLDLGKYIKGAVTGDFTGAEAEQRSMSTVATGVLIPQSLSAKIIDMARNVSLFTSANVPVIPMNTNNETIARVKNTPTFKFKDELAKAIPSEFELEPVELKAKTAYGYAYVSIEAIESSRNLSDVIYRAFSQAIADCIDNGIMYGQHNGTGYDDFAPKGILNDAGIHTISATVGAGYDDFIRAVGKVKQSNGTPSVYGINSQTDELLSLLKTTDGQYLEAPKAVKEMQQIISNELQHLETGSDALVFDPNALIIGIQKGIKVEMFTNTDYCVEHGAVGFKVCAMLDCVTVQPKHICKITGIK